MTQRASSQPFPVAVRNSELFFADASAEELSQRPFLFGDFPGRRPVKSSQITASAPPVTTRYILHTAFCCSTLLARSLDRPGQVLALKEPDIYMQLANAQRMGQGAGQSSVLRHVEKRLSDYGAAYGERVLVKPTNTANRIAKDALANSDSKTVIIHSDLRSFLLSIAKKGEEGRSFGRRLFNIFRLDHEFPNSQSDRDLFTLSDLQIAAFVWGLQCDQLNSAAQSAKGKVAAIHCDAFLADPGKTLTAASAFLDLGLSDDDIREQVNSGVFEQNSKAAEQGYDAAERESERKAFFDQYADAIGFVEDWARKLPLPQTIKAPSLL